VAGVVALAAVPLLANPVSAGPDGVSRVAMTPAPGPATPSPSSPAPLIPLPTPGQPVAQEVTDTSALITWTRSAGPVFRYSVNILLPDGTWGGWWGGPTNSFRPTNLSPNTSYTIRVWAAALPGSGYTISDYSPTTTFTTLPAGSTPATGTPPPGGGPTMTPQPFPARCRATVSVWASGYALNVVLTNTAAVPLSPWSVMFRTPGARLNQVWSATVTQNGDQVAARPVTWNDTIPVNGSASFGMTASYTGTFQPPTDFVLPGGGTCEVVVLR
jgi:cellulase/cellobiase CelA1